MITAIIWHARTGLVIRKSRHGFPQDTMESVAQNLAAYMLAEGLAAPEDFVVETMGPYGLARKVF